jgi:hypothetical protein
MCPIERRIVTASIKKTHSQCQREAKCLKSTDQPKLAGEKRVFII